MNTVYYSEIDKDRVIYLNIFITLAILVHLSGIILYVFKSHNNIYEPFIFMGGIVSILALIGGYFLRNTKYIVSGYEIKYTISFITVFEFDVRKIRKIDKKYLHFGIYGNSRKKNMRIEFLNGEQINISPKNQSDFIQHILSIHPEIIIDL